MSGLDSIIQDLKQRYAELNPILITAPVQRCGTTLLQRAVNAGEEAVIYGETFFTLEKHPLCIAGPATDFDNKKKITDATEEAFFDGKRDMDATALFPDFEAHCRMALETQYTLTKQFHDYSIEKGFKRWGWKHQPQELQGFRNFLLMMPQVSLVVIYRDLLDVAKSFRARWPNQLATEQQLVDFGKRWSDNLTFLLNRSEPKLVIHYESMVENPEPVIKKLEEFLGIKLDHGQFKKKVNAHFDQQDIKKQDLKKSKEGGKYKAPAKLNSKEIEPLLSQAKQLYTQLGYSEAA